MLRHFRIIALCVLVVLPLGCSTTQPPVANSDYPLKVFEGIPGIWVPANPVAGAGDFAPNAGASDLTYDASGPFVIRMDEVPLPAVDPDLTGLIQRPDVGRIENQLTDEEAELLREQALLLPPSSAIDGPDLADPELMSPVLGTGFASLDANDCCGGGLSVHLILSWPLDPTTS